MGYHTSPVVAFLLTLFNLRLGWWFPNPGRRPAERCSPRFNLQLPVRRTVRRRDDTVAFRQRSDGGHFENLAAYELISAAAG